MLSFLDLTALLLVLSAAGGWPNHRVVHLPMALALALSLPDGQAKPAVPAATCAVVLWTLFVQGSTVDEVARRTARRTPGAGAR